MVRVRCGKGHVVQVEAQVVGQEYQCPVCAMEFGLAQTIEVLPERLRLE